MKFINWERKGNFNLSEQMEYNACNCCSHRTEIYIYEYIIEKSYQFAFSYVCQFTLKPSMLTMQRSFNY